MNMEHLLRPFSTEQIRQRTTAFGHRVDYLETSTVIQRLNEAFEGEWGFRIVEHQLLEDVVVVMGELTANHIVKQQFGTCELSQDSEEGAVFSVGDAMKAAASDALKKCATLFGVGLQLYGETTLAAGDIELSDATESHPEPLTTNEEHQSYDSSAPPEEEAVQTEPDGALHADLPDMITVTDSRAEGADEAITDMQLAEIIELARRMNFTQAQVDQRAKSRYGKGLTDLARWEADEIIAKLRG